MAVFDFRKFIKLNKENLISKMMKLPSVTYEYGLIDNKLQEKIDDKELENKSIRAKLAAQTRAKYRRVKDFTESEIKDIVTSNPEMIEAEKELLKLINLARLSKLRMKVLAKTGDLATNVNHNAREELKRTHNRK